MLSPLRLGLCLAIIVFPFAGAAAKGRKSAPAAPAQQQDPNAIPLPEDLTNSKDWLEDEQAATHGPTGESRMLRQQENFQQQDPTRGTAISPYNR